MIPSMAANAHLVKSGLNADFYLNPAAEHPQQEATSSYVNTIITSTPNADGSIIHIVREGETLWAIAWLTA